jgi:PKD repeat protein
VQFGITGNGTNIEWGTAEYAAGAAASTYLLVVKYVFDEAGSTSELFVNPAVGAEPTVAIAAVAETTGSPTDIGTVVLRQGSSTPNLVIDGIRVGTTYRAVRLGLVCEEPVPAFTAPAGCAGSPVAFTDASTVVEANATYAWDVDSDGKVDYTTKGSISHTYAAAGTYTATLTITQGTCSTTSTRQVTVNALPEPTITATPANQVYTGGVPTNLYLGYGPQSLTLTAAGGVTYRWAGPAGLSATNTATPVFTATKAGTFTYTVTVTNQLGCSATKSVTISVVEVRDGNKGNPKIMVCHNGKGVYVNANEVESHLLGHKEQLGDCSGNAAKAAATVSAVTTESAPASVFEAYPNPFTERAAIRFRLTETSKAQLVVLNSVGQVVATLYSGEAEKGRDYEFALEGTTLPQGIYTCRLTTNGKVETKRLVLAK